MGRPYREVRLSGSSMIREFSGDASTDELEWHMDRRNRMVTVIRGTGWKLQLETGLPIVMREGTTYSIPKESWHRVIRGNGPLRILIQED